MPAEIHEHFDADGKKIGHTVVSRESAWDDESRKRALSLAEHENSICGCGCGLPVAVSHDPDQPFKVDSIVCRAGKAKAEVERAEREKHEKDPDGVWADGRRWYVVPVDDDRPAEQRGGARGDRAHRPGPAQG